MCRCGNADSNNTVMITFWLTHHFARGAQTGTGCDAMRKLSVHNPDRLWSSTEIPPACRHYMYMLSCERLTSWLHCTYQSVRLYTYIVCCVIPLFYHDCGKLTSIEVGFSSSFDYMWGINEQ